MKSKTPTWVASDDQILISIPETCRQLSIGRTKVYELGARQLLQLIRIDRRTLVSHRSVIELAENGTGGDR